MAEEMISVSLQNLVVTSWGTLEEKNRRGLGDGWNLAEQFVALHTEALGQISRAAGTSPSKSDQATILLAGHGLNLFIETMGLLVRGLFGVSAHLLRGLMDTQSLVYACASREDLAARYMGEGKGLKASEARKLFVADVRSQDHALAEELDMRLSVDANAANELSHVKLLHGDKLTRVESGTKTPVAWGMIDQDEARRQSQSALDQEHWLLISLKAFRADALGQRWIEELDETHARLVDHLNS